MLLKKTRQVVPQFPSLLFRVGGRLEDNSSVSRVAAIILERITRVLSTAPSMVLSFKLTVYSLLPKRLELCIVPCTSFFDRNKMRENYLDGSSLAICSLNIVVFRECRK